MALSRMPRSLTAHENLEIDKVADMTSSESNDSNTFKFDSISREIWQPDIIVVSIPENKSGAYTYVQIGVYITNNARTSFRLNPAETIIPEILTSDGQVLQGFLATNEPATTVQTNTLDTSSLGFKLTSVISKLTSLFQRSRNYLVVKARETRSINITTIFFWHNDLLFLELHTSYFSFNSHCTYWFFNALYPGKHQLRFIYLRSRGNRTDLSRREVRTRQEINSNQIATPLINLYLVQSVETNSTVEVDGIRFETLVPEKLLTIPENMREAETSVQIGMSITNNTQTPFRFNFFATLIPELVGADGQALQRNYFCLGLQSARKSDYPLAMPGEIVTRFPDAKLLWFKRDHLRLQIAAGDGGFCIFDSLQPGIYKFRFVYRKQNNFVTKNHPEKLCKQLLGWQCKTMISTPFVEICLLLPE